MCMVQPIGQERRQSRMRSRARALRNAWAAYTVKRAIAEVASTSERDYLAFGLDKHDILAALAHLRDEIGSRGRHARRDNGRFVIVVARRRLCASSPRRQPSQTPGQPVR